MKTPRNVSGKELIRILSGFGYMITRQKGSHIRLVHESLRGTHYLTVPDHTPLKIGTLSAIVNEAASYLGVDKERIFKEL